MKTNLETILLEIEILARSTKEDFDNGFWDNYCNYLKQYNDVLCKLHNLGHFENLKPILPVRNGEKAFGGVGFSSVERAKLREVVNASERMKREIKLLVPTEKNDNETKEEALNRIECLCTRFHLVVRQIEKRYNNRGTLKVQDEYDVQDLFHSLLRIDFDDIRTEIWTPELGGGSTRMDFVLNNEDIVIETKMTRNSLNKKRLGEELLIDIAKYKIFPKCKNLVCFIYDPQGRIENPRGFETDLENTTKEIKVVAYIRPTGE